MALWDAAFEAAVDSAVLADFAGGVVEFLALAVDESSLGEDAVSLGGLGCLEGGLG